MSAKTPHSYQREAVDALYRYWRNHQGNGLIVVPTGGGKSFIMSMLIKEIREQWPGTRILILTHVAELIDQDFQELKENWPEAPAGIFSAGLGRKDLHAPILFAGIQSIDDHAHKLDPAPEIVLIDEAHLIPRKSETRYMKTLHTLKLMYPHLRVVGLTATPYRLDSGWLHKGDGAIFDDIVFDIPIQRLIDAGHLVPVIAKRGEVTIDTSEVHKRGGEYIPSELQKAATAGDTTSQAVADLLKRGSQRKSWLVFTTGCDHAKQVRDALTEAGITSEMILGDTPKRSRARFIDEHRRGVIRALVSVDTLTTGYNNPRLDLIANLRPTASPGLWVQMIGRGTRTSPGKENCLLLDYTDNSLRIGPIDAIEPVAPRKGDGTPPAKECPDCMAIIPAGCLTCPYCGHVFPPPAPKIERLPTEAPILKSQIAPVRHEVKSARYFPHKKEGRPDSVRIEYQIGDIMQHREWVFPERTSDKQAFFYGKYMAEIGLPYEQWPRNAADFIEMANRGEIPTPRAISVKKDGKFWTITGREY